MRTTTLPYKMIEKNADTLTPIGIYQSLSGTKKCLLESSFRHEEKGKFSFIGADPYKEFIGREQTATIKNLENGTTENRNEPVLAVFQQEFPKLDLDLPFPFIGGAIGYIGYDAIRTYETIGDAPADDVNMPGVHLMLYKNIIVYDHRNETVFLIATNTEQESEEQLDERLAQLQNALVPLPATDIADIQMTFQPEMEKEAFIRNVEIAKQHIRRGDIFQVVLSQRMKAQIDGDPFHFYRKLRKANPSPYMFYIDFEDYLLLGASPESLIQTRNCDITANPIAGTRPRGSTKEQDETLARELLTDEKEISEHRMLVDLSRNDLSKISDANSISVPTYMQIEKYQHVMHMVSEVTGKLASGYSSIDALIACLPAGTVSGTPKIRAMQIINQLENRKRGAYGGGVGYINFNHDLNMALTIRSLIIKNKQAYLQAGAGIVYDSDPESEYNETLHKARSLMEVNK